MKYQIINTLGWDDDAANNSSWLVTPAVTSANQLTFYACDGFDPTNYNSTLSVKVSTTDQTTTGDFTNLLTITEAEAGHGDMTQYTVDLSAYSGSPVYVAFVMHDDDVDGDEWFIEDVQITATASHDLGVTTIYPPFLLPGETVTPQVTVTSYSTEAESNFEVELTDGNGYTSLITITEPLAATESIVVDMDDWAPTDGNHTLTATVTNIDDANTDNNTLETQCLVSGYNDANYVSNTTDLTYGTVDLANGDFTENGEIWEIPTIQCEEYNGTYIYRIDADNNIFIIAPNGVYIPKGPITGVVNYIYGLTWDWVNEQMYIITFADNTSKLFTLNLETLAATQVGTNINETIVHLEMANDGYLYAIKYPEGAEEILVKIDKTNAQVTEIGAVGANFNYATISYDAQANIMYSYNIDNNTETSTFGTYNLVTGEFTEITSGINKIYRTLAITKDGTPTLINETINSNILIYPNPSTGIFTIQNLKNSKIQKLIITDITGKIIFSKDKACLVSTIDISNQPAGIYFINIKTENNIFTQKIIIQ